MMETEAIRCLADAAEHLEMAKGCTKIGFAADYCENALAEIRKAIRMACAEELA